jgi:hypothetical protein
VKPEDREFPEVNSTDAVENMVLRISGHNREKVSAGWRKENNEELHNF